MDLEEKIGRLFKAQGVREQMGKLLDRFIMHMAEEKFDDFTKYGKVEPARERALEWMMNQLTLTFNEHCTEEQIDAAIEFYESPSGQAMAKAEMQMFGRLSSLTEKALEKFASEVL